MITLSPLRCLAHCHFMAIELPYLASLLLVFGTVYIWHSSLKYSWNKILNASCNSQKTVAHASFF